MTLSVWTMACSEQTYAFGEKENSTGFPSESHVPFLSEVYIANNYKVYGSLLFVTAKACLKKSEAFYEILPVWFKICYGFL